jgi:hypothetical protein
MCNDHILNKRLIKSKNAKIFSRTRVVKPRETERLLCMQTVCQMKNSDWPGKLPKMGSRAAPMPGNCTDSVHRTDRTCTKAWIKIETPGVCAAFFPAAPQAVVVQRGRYGAVVYRYDFHPGRRTLADQAEK